MDKNTNSGALNAIAAYTMWGFAPIYFKLIEHVGAPEILVHRVLWSFLLLALIILIRRQWHNVSQILKQKKLLLKLTITALFLGCNWLLFIWAVNNDHLLDASLGYYINPLFNVALGMMFLGERLGKLQKYAVALAVTGVLIQLISLGTLPIISLVLASTFGIYGLLRKKMMVDSFAGLLIESALMVPIAIVYWLFFLDSSSSDLTQNTAYLNTLLICSGIVTTAPLLCFTAAAKRLTLTTLGFFQYIGPSLMFLLAVYIYQEPLLIEKLVTFGFIWTALALYSYDSLKTAKRKRVKA